MLKLRLNNVLKSAIKINLVALLLINNVYNNIYAVDATPKKPNNQELMSVDILQYQVDQDPSRNYNANSGYYALKNGVLILNGIKYNADPTKEINDPSITQNLFQDISSPWRSYIINSRTDKVATRFIKTNLLEVLNGYKKDNKVPNNNVHYYLTQVLEYVVKDIEDLYLSNEGLFKICKVDAEDILNIFVEKIINKFAIKNKTELDKLLPVFKDINFKICDKNIKDLTKSNSSDNFNINDQESPGSWLSSKEIINLYEFEKAKKFAIDGLNIPLTCIKDIKKDINSILDALNKVTTYEETLLIINVAERWVPCVVSRSVDKIKYFVVDLFNANLKENTDFLNFVKLINMAFKELYEQDNNQVGADNSNNGKFPISFDPKKQNHTNQQNAQNNVEEKNDYRSPYFDIETEQLPKLEQFFNGTVPNQVINLIDNLKISKKNSFRTDTKKGLVLYGPPGTGKSTIAEIIARESGREVLFIDGGSFKTEYQGSGARIVSELFQAARAKNKPVVIIIDEIDGATSKLRKGFGTSEDNQTIKKIISELNKHLLSKDSSIYLICTTNYLENIESAILNRFTSIEVNAPNYAARLDILSNYLKINDIAVQDETPSNFEVSKEFLKILATATSGWTGRDLQAVINNAVSEYKNPRLSPENNSLWKFISYNKYDFQNRKLRSLLLSPVMGLVPLFAYKKNYTRLERFLYSSYLSELQKIQKVKASEADANPYNDSISKQLKSAAINATTGFVITTVLTGLHRHFFPESSTGIKKLDPTG